MRKSFLLLIFVVYIIITGYYTGAGRQGYEVTGAENGGGTLTNAGCTCHSLTANPAISLAIELDSAGISTDHYSGGLSYTVKLTGINNDTSLLPKFGFQICSIEGSLTGPSTVNTGTWSLPLPVYTHYEPPQATYFNIGVVEQSRAITATTGNGGTGSTYMQTFNWIAPPAGTGTISFWAVLNAVNGDGYSDTGDKWDTAHMVISEWMTSVGIQTQKLVEQSIQLFPNPASNNIFIKHLNKDLINSISIFNAAGNKQTLFFSSNNKDENLELNVSSYSPGIYFLEILAGKQKYIKRFVKN